MQLHNRATNDSNLERILAHIPEAGKLSDEALEGVLKMSDDELRAYSRKNGNLVAEGNLNVTLSELQGTFNNLIESDLIIKYRALDPNLKYGYTGSFKTGFVGNPHKPTFGNPVNLKEFDIDFWIESDILFKKFGSNLRADPLFRKILNETPGFEGLKPNKQGFSIKFKPSN